MTSTFEIKYIEIQWYDKDTVTKVIESLHVIPVEYNDEHSHFECETTIYPRTEGILRGQLAVRFIAEASGDPLHQNVGRCRATTLSR
jgi:hypothetical protein